MVAVQRGRSRWAYASRFNALRLISSYAYVVIPPKVVIIIIISIIKECLEETVLLKDSRFNLCGSSWARACASVSVSLSD